eukprot:SAG11_NODE_29_length_23137_cov_16.739995_3_plen_1059_part_00
MHDACVPTLAAETTHDKLDMLRQHRDNLVEDARKELDHIVQLQAKMSIGQMRDALDKHDLLGEYVEKQRRAIERQISEADDSLAELQQLYESNDFIRLAAAVDKYRDVPIQTQIVEVSEAWAHILEMRRVFVEQGHIRAQEILQKIDVEPAELLQIIKDLQDTYGGLELVDEIRKFTEIYDELKRRAVEAASSSLEQAEGKEADSPGTGLQAIEDALVLVIKFLDLVDLVKEMQRSFEDVVAAEHAEADSVDQNIEDFDRLLHVEQRLLQLEKYLQTPASLALGKFAGLKEMLGVSTSSKLDMLTDKLDMLVSDAHKELASVAQLQTKMSIGQMHNAMDRYAPLGEHVVHEQGAIQERISEAESSCAELQNLCDSDDFITLAAAVDKFRDVPIQTHVVEVSDAWAHVLELRDELISRAREQLIEELIPFSTEKTIELVAGVEKRFGPYVVQHLDKEMRRVWSKLADRRDELLSKMHTMIEADKAEILEMEAVLHEFEKIPTKSLFLSTGEGRWDLLRRSRKEERTYRKLHQKMLQTIGMGRSEVVRLLHGEPDSVPQIDKVLHLYGRAGSDLEELLQKLRERRQELKSRVLEEHNDALAKHDTPPSTCLKIIADLEYFTELGQEKELLIEYNAQTVENARAAIGDLLKKHELHVLVNSAWRFEKFLEGTDLREIWVQLVKHSAHVAADAKKFIKFNQEEPVVKLLTACPDSVQSADSNGRLPLHTAVATRSQATLIRDILKLYPDAVLKRDVNGCLPLHLALLHKLSPEVLLMLLDVRSAEDDTARKRCCGLCGTDSASLQNEAERKINEILTSRTEPLDAWKDIEKVNVKELVRAKPPVTEPTALQFALQNSDIETPVKIVRLLGWEKEYNKGWEALAISAARSDVVFELGDPAKIAQVRPSIAKEQFIRLFSVILTCLSWHKIRREKNLPPHIATRRQEARAAKAKKMALWFELTFIPIAMLVGLVSSNYFDVTTDMMMVFGFLGTEDYAFFVVSAGLLMTSMILTCIMDYFQSGCKGLGKKIFLNVTELRLIEEAYRALQMWKRGLKPQRGFATV